MTSRDRTDHPTHYRRSILIAALVAMGTWWGLGMPYSVFSWLLDEEQLLWVLICYAWEVPAAGFLGPVLIPQLWWRRIERQWDRVFADPDQVDSDAALALERVLLDYPMRVAVVLLVTSLIGYGVGAVQLRIFAELPGAEIVKVMALGLVTGLVGALFAFLYLEWRIAPLLRHLGMVNAGARPAGYRIPLYAKVFACSVILTVTALLLLGVVFYSRGERILETEVGRRVLTGTRYAAAELAQDPGRAQTPAWWETLQRQIGLGRSGYAYLVDAGGTVIAGTSRIAHLGDEHFRASVVERILASDGGHLVDRVYTPRIVAYSAVHGTERHLVAVVARAEFAGELDTMLRRGGAVFIVALLIALSQGYLFSHRLTRPIEVVTRMASEITRAPEGSWKRVAVRTNDEVGELATAFNQMTERLEHARGALQQYSAELERRIEEATQNLSTLYDMARTTTSTLELEDVLKAVAERALATLGLDRLVLLRRATELGSVDAYTTSAGTTAVPLELAEPVDLDALSHAGKPTITSLDALGPAVPPTIRALLGGPEVLCLPLVFKDNLLGVILASHGPERGLPDLELAGTLAGQAAAALANAGLFATVRQHETELRRLSQMRLQMQEENLRGLSRELHDGVGQVLTAIKIDLGMLERATDLDVETMQGHVREIREQVTELLQEVRTMSQLLRPSMLDDFGLVPTLQWLIEKFSARTDIDVELRTPPAETRLPGAIEVLLYRVTQEALTNVVKHAQARHVDVALEVRAGEAALTIADDGVGFDLERFRRAPTPEGVGLLGMRERVAYYHGQIDIRTRPHAGTRITLTIPIDASATDGGQGQPVPLAG